MNEPRDTHHDPDQAALDELTRAFADELPAAESPPATGTPEPAPTAATSPDWIDDTPVPEDDSIELVIVEQDPLPPTADPTPEPPAIIRIDDYSGSVEIERDPDEPAGPPATPPAESAVTDDPHADPVVIAIDDAELPDAVYVEGSLDGDGSRTIVFIEDDDTGDTLVPETERDIRRGIEPRMRERRVAVKRAQGRKRMKWVALGLGGFVLVVGVLALLGSSLFAVQEDQVTLTGNVYTDPEELQAILDDLIGTPVLLVDSQGIERDLEAIPWVDEAKVVVDFPHAASIEIRERAAMATYRGPDGLFRVLDREGRVLDVIENYPFAYVLLTGPDPVDLEAGEFAPRGYAAAADLAKNLTGSVRGRVEMIQVAADGSRLTMLLDDGSEVRFGDARDLFVKLVRLETVLSSGEERPPGIIDVSTREVTVPEATSSQDGS